jgi:hypothetical protein
MLRHRDHREPAQRSRKTQMFRMNLLSAAAFELRTAAPVGAAVRGRSVPFLT